MSHHQPHGVLFPLWRAHWATRQEGTLKLLHEFESLLARRIEVQTPKQHEWVRAWDLVEDMQNLVDEPANRSEWLNRHARFFDLALWPRWLLLEAALLDAARHSDFLAMAALLRTMIDDTILLAHLDALGAQTTSTAEAASLVATLRATCMPSIDPVAQLKVGNLNTGPSITTEPSTDLAPLRRARGRLNTYLHPNLGSNLAVVTPDNSAIADAVLMAAIATYTVFMSLARVRRRPAAPRGSRLAPVKRSTMESVLMAAERQIDRMPSRTSVDRARRVRNRESLTRHRHMMHAQWRHAQDFPAITPSSLSTTLRHLGIDLGSPDLPARVAMAGLPPSPMAARTMLGQAVIDYERLQQLAAADPVSEVGRPTEFHWRLSHFIVDLTNLKCEGLRFSVARAIAARNPLAAAILARSLIEHRSLLRAIAIKSSTENALDGYVREMGVLFASGRKQFNDAERLTTYLNDLGTSGSIHGLGQRVREGWGEGAYLTWNRLSNIMKGRQMTGPDLLEKAGPDANWTWLGVGLGVETLAYDLNHDYVSDAMDAVKSRMIRDSVSSAESL